jgi:hypothetical protein
VMPKLLVDAPTSWCQPLPLVAPDARSAASSGRSKNAPDARSAASSGRSKNHLVE